jgi:hypothetical protein
MVVATRLSSCRARRSFICASSRHASVALRKGARSHAAFAASLALISVALDSAVAKVRSVTPMRSRTSFGRRSQVFGRRWQVLRLNQCHIGV